ncbi:MAG TPA: hypothetical protein VK589_15440 [Chryseolinea sp.]|nr:hypothetical protein [Chryseolinea sp.]
MKTKTNVIISILVVALFLIGCVEEEIRPTPPSGSAQSIVTLKSNNVPIK